MRILSFAAALALAACSSNTSSPTAPSAPATATIEASGTANAFSPTPTTIARGGTVTWTFAARPHNVTFAATPGAPDNVPTSTNTQASRTFASAGTFVYNCTVHSGMTGTVIVQ